MMAFVHTHDRLYAKYYCFVNIDGLPISSPHPTNTHDAKIDIPGALSQALHFSTAATRTERDTFGPLEVAGDKCAYYDMRNIS